MRSACLAMLAALAVYATTPRPAASDYPASAAWNGMKVGAEYTVHSIGAGKGMYFAKDFLVVEIAIYPEKLIEISDEGFRLRINNAKFPVQAAAPSFVAAALKYPDWNGQRSLEIGAGVGDAEVVVGRPQTVGRFPGDRADVESRRPRLPRAPQDGRAPTSEVDDPGAAVTGMALQPGSITTPRAGLLYFPYAGKAEKIKHLSLLYQAGEHVEELILR